MHTLPFRRHDNCRIFHRTAIFARTAANTFFGIDSRPLCCIHNNRMHGTLLCAYQATLTLRPGQAGVLIDICHANPYILDCYILQGPGRAHFGAKHAQFAAPLSRHKPRRLEGKYTFADRHRNQALAGTYFDAAGTPVAGGEKITFRQGSRRPENLGCRTAASKELRNEKTQRCCADDCYASGNKSPPGLPGSRASVACFLPRNCLGWTDRPTPAA